MSKCCFTNSWFTNEVTDLGGQNPSGFAGKVVAVTEWLTGCRRITIQPPGLDDKGRPFERETFDETEVEVEVVSDEKASSNDGGPRPSIGKRSDPV